MKYRKTIREEMLFFIFLPLIKEICTQECGWAHRIERYLFEPDAMEGSWPWMVAIARRNGTGDYTHECSGSMITRRHVLVSAQCFINNSDPSLYVARVGHIDERLAEEYNVSQLVIHDTYTEGLLKDDIAILTLEKDVESEDFNPVCLPPSGEFKNLTGHFTALIGWGLSAPSWARYPILREKFDLVVIPNARCNEVLKRNTSDFRSNSSQEIIGNMICTEYPSDCIGDYGSPLIYEVADQWYIVGLLSFKGSCEKPGILTYTKVSEYLEWIEKHINEVCGISRRMHDSVRDDEAPLGSWPWMAGIGEYKSYGGGGFEIRCTGSMISRKHVLLSNSCFDRHFDAYANYKAKIGHVNGSLAEEYNIVVKKYHNTNYRNDFVGDLAIMTLDREVDFEGFYPVCLPSSSDFVNLTGRFNALVGWDNGLKGKNLQEKFGLTVINSSKCHEIFRNIAPNFMHAKYNIFGDKIFCTNSVKRCDFAPGSPLLYQKDDRWYVVGLTAVINLCSFPGGPTGYTIVSKYLNWIRKNTVR